MVLLRSLNAVPYEILCSVSGTIDRSCRGAAQAVLRFGASGLIGDEEITG
jgi:hypothetical protein